MNSRLIRLPSGTIMLEAELTLPSPARGLVIFVHGSGSSRHSSRNRMVAQGLNQSGFAALLFDLLSVDEDRDYQKRFDIALLVQRLESAVRWVQQDVEVNSLPIGLFGASTGAAAALRVAALQPSAIRAVVSRGGRPDMANAEFLSKVLAPTLLIVGSRDSEVLELNRVAQMLMPGSANLLVVPGATHLFEEPGALDQVLQAAENWFDTYLSS